MKAICVGCNQGSDAMPEYTKDDPVTEDGTYADGKFVCTACYCFLVDMGLDIGTPQELQDSAMQYVRPLNL